jgi:putative heme-binding domain-containing protein
MLQRLPVNQRAELAAALASHAEDADDHNLPAMVWYGLIPVADQKLEALVSIAAETRWPQLRQWIARRLSEDLAKRPNALDKLLAVAAAPEHADLLADVLVGMTDATAGLHKVPRPKSWQAVQTAAESSTNETVRNQARDLSILFGDGRALDEVRKLALDDKADLQRRRVALEALIQSRPDDLRPICEKLLNVRFLNTTAARGLALFNDPAIGAKLASSYSKFHHSERSAVMETLVSRPIFAAAMLDQMEAGKIARGDLSAFQARQIRSFNDEKLAKRLADVWGEIRDSSADKQKLISGLKESLTTAAIESAQPERGREVFNKVCANCHRLYGHGAEIGPDLTGAGRQNIDYLLGNIIDPSAVVTADFRMSVVLTTDGRVINGIVKAQSPQSITLQTAKERVTLARSDIDTLEVSPLSLMPDNLLQPLTAEQIRDLVAYLMTRSQVPLPADATPSGQ